MSDNLKQLQELIDLQEQQLKNDTKDMNPLDRIYNAMQIHGVEQYLKGLKKARDIIVGQQYKTITKANCKGCYNEVYNQGLGGAKECWSFATAELIMRKEVHIDQRPPWNQEAKLLPSCYRKERYVYVKPDQTC